MSIIPKKLIIDQLESTEEFPIALSEAWEWLGFSTKGNAQKSFNRMELNKGEDFEVFILKDNSPNGGRPQADIYLTIDCFKLWAMSAQTLKGNEVRRYYLQVEKEWKAQKSAYPQVSIEQVEAFQFQKNVFLPWVKDNPVASEVFLSWQGIKTQAIDCLPSSATQDALNGAFLNLNRSGLMMNKLFKFLDRIPTMKTLDEDFINELVESLSESENTIEGLKSNLSEESKALKKALADLRAKTIAYESLKRSQSAQNTASQESGKVSIWTGADPKRLKSAT